MFGFRECDSEIVYRIKAAAADAESQRSMAWTSLYLASAAEMAGEGCRTLLDEIAVAGEVFTSKALPLHARAVRGIKPICFPKATCLPS